MKTLDGSNKKSKERHGCVTTWLIFMIIVNSLIAISILLYYARGKIVHTFSDYFLSKNVTMLDIEISNSMLILFTIVVIAKIIFSVLLLNWKKIGFWGFVLSCIGSMIVYFNMDAGIIRSISELIGIAVLFGVLQIKKEGVSTWTNFN